MDINIVQKIILWAIPLIFAITVHEVAHGWVANKLGDPTAKNAGRLTLNPIKHIDILGTIIIPGILVILGGIVFGYAKPVPVNWHNLRRPRRDMAIVALAGPLSNLMMAFIWALVAKFGALFYASSSHYVGFILYYMGTVGIMINLVLMVLNLIPIPPLDGSRVVASFLQGQAAEFYAKIEPYGFFILLGLLALGVLGKILLPFVNFFSHAIYSLFGLLNT
jgi:Zn-dependent protease